MNTTNPTPPNNPDDTIPEIWMAAVAAVAEASGVPPYNIISASRLRPHTEARMAASLLCHRAGLSLVRIGSLMRRTHSSIGHQCQQAQNLYDVDRAFRAMYNRAKTILVNHQPNTPQP